MAADTTALVWDIEKAKEKTTRPETKIDANATSQVPYPNRSAPTASPTADSCERSAVDTALEI